MMKCKIDPRQSPDWQIAEAHEASMKPAIQLGRELGLNEDELIPHGKWLAKVDHKSAFQRLQSSSRGKYIDVTAITPTPLGEGKTTTAIGLIQGLGRLGHKVSGALRQPSGGPTFNVKGSAAGGGLAQCIPLTPFCLGLTGDIDRINNAHNLAMVALTSRMGVCMAKTHLSLSDDPGRKGRPRDWRLSIGEILVYHGAELVVPVAGEIKLMPGTGSNPAFRRIDVEVETGKVTGLF